MRKITNRSGFPDAVYQALLNDDYDRGECDYTATELISPPRILALKREHNDKVEIDVEDLIYAFEGKILHKVLEMANRTGLVEKRFFTNVGKFVISAQVDTLSWDDDNPKILSDWKRTTIYKLKGRPDADWESQTNIQAYILRANGIEVDGIQIIGFAKDHSKIKAMMDPRYRPRKAIVKIPIQMWSKEKTEEFIRMRIEIHEAAKKELPECTNDEHWGNKRCLAYGAECAPFCDQWKNKQKEKQDEI